MGSKIVAELDELHLLVVNFDALAPTKCTGLYHTKSCKALLAVNTVLVNEEFLMETEAAIRSFGLTKNFIDSPYLRSDEELFGLVKRIRINPQRYLRRLRRLQHKEAELRETFALTIFFFVAHEIGHILDQVDQHSFTTFIDPLSPVENEVANAVVKLTRHAREFERVGMGLKGFEAPLNRESDIGQLNAELQEEIANITINNEKWFKDENSADDWAAKIANEYFVQLSVNSEVGSDKQLCLFAKGLFAAGLYSWYKDLLAFGEKLGWSKVGAAQLTFNMWRDKRQYIRAASLFGNVHRFTLLRVIFALEAVLMERTDFFRDNDNSKRELTNEQEWWLMESMQRYWLLSILVDTAVKIAYIGGAAGWMLEKERQGQRKPLHVTFEPIITAVRRLQDMLKEP